MGECIWDTHFDKPLYQLEARGVILRNATKNAAKHTPINAGQHQLQHPIFPHVNLKLVFRNATLKQEKNAVKLTTKNAGQHQEQNLTGESVGLQNSYRDPSSLITPKSSTK